MHIDILYNILILSGINIIIVLGLNLITGVTGQLSLGHAAFVSIGAYSSSILMMSLGVPFGVALIAAFIIAGLVGGLFGIPILRLHGDYFAIATLGFCEVVRVIMMNMKATINGESQYFYFSSSCCIIYD